MRKDAVSDLLRSSVADKSLPTCSFITELQATSIFLQPQTLTYISLDLLRSSPWCHGFPQCDYYGGTPLCSRKTACFEALVLEPHIALILRPLLATLSPPLLAEFAASIILLEDAKCEMAGLSNTCGLPMFK